MCEQKLNYLDLFSCYKISTNKNVPNYQNRNFHIFRLGMSWSGSVAARAIHGNTGNRSRSRTGSFGSGLRATKKLPKKDSDFGIISLY